MTIDVLPDDVLVEIFFYVIICDSDSSLQNPWHVLVHVCRRWRHLVFAFPRRLNLRLEYEGRRPISEALDPWPVLPVILLSSDETLPSGLPHPMLDQRCDNVVAALESAHYDRICEIEILNNMTNTRWERFAAAMQKPFPELTYLVVVGDGDMVPVLPDSFLGGSAPRLRELELDAIPFPSIPKLLLSAHGLVTLTLWNIPDSGYISPDAMATSLTVMTRLKTLYLSFRSPRSHPDPENRPLPPPTRFILTALTEFVFQGVYEYSEDLLARIDAPRLYDLNIVFLIDPNFDLPQLHRLISHADEFKAFDRAEVLIFDHLIQLKLYPKTGVVDHRSQLDLEIICGCGELDHRISSLAQVCSSSFPLISALEELEIRQDEDATWEHWNVDMENARWLELLDPFAALKNLYLTYDISQRVCDALQELSEERATEVLPTLRNLFVSGYQPSEHIEEAIRPFVVRRQLSGHPVTVDHWHRRY